MLMNHLAGPAFYKAMLKMKSYISWMLPTRKKFPLNPILKNMSKVCETVLEIDLRAIKTQCYLLKK